MCQRPSIRLRRLIIWIAVAATISATVSSASALAGSACSDFTRPACSIRLSTGITMGYRVVEGLWHQAFVDAGYSWPADVYNLSPAVAAPDFNERHLTVPTLVLYATQDDIFSPVDEQTLIDSLTTAAAGRGVRS
jgi:pimeloyl-ACP methyl ester carboxylesterase